MAFLEKQLYIKKSKIPNAGKGLFTKEAIPKGTRIVEYKGKRTAWKNVKDDDGRNGYIFYITRNTVIDARNTLQHFARYCNDAGGFTRIKGLKNNCEYVIEGKRCFVEAKYDIPRNGELYVSYGPEYWQTMRENLRIEKQEQKERERQEKEKVKKEARKKKEAEKKAKKKQLEAEKKAKKKEKEAELKAKKKAKEAEKKAKKKAKKKVSKVGKKAKRKKK